SAGGLMNIPRPGTKDRILFDLLTRPEGATLHELNRATGWSAYSYINDTKRLAERCGLTPHWTGGGGSRRFWIDQQNAQVVQNPIAADKEPEAQSIRGI